MRLQTEHLKLQTPAAGGLEVVVVVTRFEGGGLLVFGHLTFEEVLLLLEVDGFGKPREGVLDIATGEGLEAAVHKAAIGDVVDVLLELINTQTDRGDGEAVADERFLKADAFGHGLAEVFLELRSHDVWILGGERVEKVEEDFDVVGLVAQGVAEHLANTGKFILAVEAEDHAEEAVELGPFHDLAEHEDVFGEGLLVFEDGEVDVAAEGAGVGNDEVVFRFDGGNVLEHGLAFVRVDAE